MLDFVLLLSLVHTNLSKPNSILLSQPQDQILSQKIQPQCYLKNVAQPLDPWLHYLLFFVSNTTIKVSSTEATIFPYIDSAISQEPIGISINDFQLQGPPELLTLSQIGSLTLADALIEMLEDSNRAWAAHIMLAKLTRKKGILFVQYSNSKEWWNQEGKTGKAKKMWQESFFKRKGYEVCWNPKESYFFIIPHKQAEPNFKN